MSSPTLARLLPSTATPSQPTAPGTGTRNPGRAEGCLRGRHQGVGCVRVGSGAHSPEPGARARSLQESFTGKRTEEEGDSGLGPLIYAKENLIHDRRQMAHGQAKQPTMPGCELGPIPHRQGAQSGRKGSPAARAGLHTYADFSRILICYLKCKEGERDIRLLAFRLRELRRTSCKRILRRQAETGNRSGCSHGGGQEEHRDFQEFYPEGSRAWS